MSKSAREFRVYRIARAIEKILAANGELVEYHLYSEIADMTVTEQIETLLCTIEDYVLPTMAEQDN